MLRSLRYVTIVASLLLLGGGWARMLANTHYPATVTFSDRDGDNVTSDYQTSGKHTYVDGGADGLECGFWLDSRDFVLRKINGPTPKKPRFLAFSYTPITSGAPAGLLQEYDLFMNIRDILSMPNTGMNAIAIFQTSVGAFKLTPNTNWIDPATYATQVFVSRTGNVWTVTADPGVPPGPGDVAALTKTKGYKETLVGLYHMPFQITVTCPTCP